MVFVLDRRKKPLMPCSEKRARLLLERGRAVVHKMQPFTIRLRDRTQEASTLQPVVLKLDPGSKFTGIALVREEVRDDGLHHHALHLAEVQHRGDVVRATMLKRAARRRGRRSRTLRYRPPRFHNRTRKPGWLPPSLRSRNDNVVGWANRYRRLAPVIRIDMELVRFDTHKLQNPEIDGVEYQWGTLFGVEVWQYLLTKWGHKCAYCQRNDVPLEKEHIIPRSRLGSNRVSNLCPSCRPCNREKGNQTAAEFGHPEVEHHARAPLRDAAAVNATRFALRQQIEDEGFVVTSWSGGRTKWNRTRFGIEKSHAMDALSVGDIAGAHSSHHYMHAFKAMGRNTRQRRLSDAFGFPRGTPRTRVVHGFQTGDLVRATVPAGLKTSGTRVGRVAVRASGSFRVGSVDGISWRYCQLLQRSNGYDMWRAAARPQFLPALTDGVSLRR
jgi:5-methylcytosine-specific restriction endonuclease McrA